MKGISQYPFIQKNVWELTLLAATVAVFFLNIFASPYFLDPWNLSDATFNFTEKAIIALPMALLIIAREIDLSIASIIALCSVGMGYIAQLSDSVPLMVAAGLFIGLLCGFVNGCLVTYFSIPSIVVTIGTMSLFRGICYIALGDGVLKNYLIRSIPKLRYTVYLTLCTRQY